MSKSFLSDYLDELPGVAASLTTALIVFIASLSFKPVRDWVFAPEVKGYPITCSFKPRIDSERKILVIEGFFINTTDKSLDRKALDGLLSASAEAPRSSTIVVRYSADSPGRIVAARAAESFNYFRGKLRVELKENQHVEISIEGIDPRAILKADIEIAGRDMLIANQPDETAGALPVPLEGVIRLQHGGCYQ
mgnify:CR=1 FL=1